MHIIVYLQYSNSDFVFRGNGRCKISAAEGRLDGYGEISCFNRDACSGNSTTQEEGLCFVHYRILGILRNIRHNKIPYYFPIHRVTFCPLNIIIRNESDHKIDMISIIRNKSVTPHPERV